MNRAALRYAKAVLNLAKDANNTAEVNNDMLLINNTIEGSKELHLFLNNPVSKTDAKMNVLTGLFSDKVNKTTNNLLQILVANKRVTLLPFVAKQYIQLFEKMKGVEVAKITTAIPLTDDLKNKVLVKVKELTNKEVSVENIIDESILGGFILQVGDKQFDASISGKLGNLKRNFETNHYEAKN
ncbi:MAG: ATP synthase F1 subunit delta [Flavobacteriaceae bacterium]